MFENVRQKLLQHGENKNLKCGRNALTIVLIPDEF